MIILARYVIIIIMLMCMCFGWMYYWRGYFVVGVGYVPIRLCLQLFDIMYAVSVSTCLIPCDGAWSGREGQKLGCVLLFVALNVC